jgi:hypothetical protein
MNNSLRTTAPMNHSGVQPWSQGAIFPGVISRVETYVDPYMIVNDEVDEHDSFERPATLAERLIGAKWLARWRADERLCDSYEEAEAWILTRKELDEEEKPYGRQADGIYQGELAGVRS